MKPPEFGSLFTGFGGFDLGLERAGWKCAWQVEINDYAQRVLRRHWPSVRRFSDVRACGVRNLKRVPLVVGGFPCTDISEAGYQAGIEAGNHSSLWREQYRIIRELRPRFALVENVSALLERDMRIVLGDLAEGGFDAEWESVRAADVGAPHQRERVFILAYPHGVGLQTAPILDRVALEACREAAGARTWRGGYRHGASGRVRLVPDDRVFGVANGIPERMEQHRGLGNAIVPLLGEWAGGCILRYINRDQPR